MSGRAIGVLVCVLAALAGCAGTPPTSSDADIVRDSFPEAEAAVRERMRALEDMVNRHDLDGLRAAHLASPKFSKIQQGKGRQDFAAMIAEETAWASAVQSLSIDFRDLEIDVFGDVAVASSFPRFTMTDANGGTVELDVVSTMVWVRTPTGWKIAHEQNTPDGPVRPVTGVPAPAEGTQPE